jgi:hypothetical protein
MATKNITKITENLLTFYTHTHTHTSAHTHTQTAAKNRVTLYCTEFPNKYAFCATGIFSVCIYIETRRPMYEGDSNENIKSAIKIQNTARLSCKFTIIIILMV